MHIPQDNQLIPFLAELLYGLDACKYFSPFNLAAGVYQIEISDRCKHKTAFSTLDSHYQYLHSPMGL